MTNFDCHTERSDLLGIVLLDLAPENEGIGLKAVDAYRLGRVHSLQIGLKINILIRV